MELEKEQRRILVCSLNDMGKLIAIITPAVWTEIKGSHRKTTAVVKGYRYSGQAEKEDLSNREDL